MTLDTPLLSNEELRTRKSLNKADSGETEINASSDVSGRAHSSSIGCSYRDCTTTKNRIEQGVKYIEDGTLFRKLSENFFPFPPSSYSLCPYDSMSVSEQDYSRLFGDDDVSRSHLVCKNEKSSDEHNVETPRDMSASRRHNWITAAHRTRKFWVLEISNGQCYRFEMQAHELLRRVHLHNKEHSLQETVVGALKLRDLRQVVSPHGRQRPSIEVRRNCILINLLRIRAIILNGCVLILPSVFCNGFETAAAFDFSSRKGNSTSIWEDLEEDASDFECRDGPLVTKLTRFCNLKNSSPFELTVLENLLIQVCEDLHAELTPIRLAADTLLRYIHEQPSSTRKLHTVTELRRRLDSITDKTKGVETALKEILDSEDAIRRLEVSFFWENPDKWEQPPRTGSAEDAEIMLECYEQEIESLLKVIKRTDGALDDALQIMELHLASIRNAFLKSEIALDVIGVVFGAVAAVAGIFGMNIRNGWEDELSYFWLISLLLLLLCLSTIALVFLWFRKQKL